LEEVTPIGLGSGVPGELCSMLCGLSGLLSAISFLLGSFSLLVGGSLSPHSTQGLPGTSCYAKEQRGGNNCGRRKSEFVPSHESLEAVEPTRGMGGNRLTVQVALNIKRQLVGRFITTGAVLFQALHHNPVQVATDIVNEFGRHGLPAFG
jgi:hypothetical protein